MRLLHTAIYTLEEFVGDSIPKYAILSHTWEGKEVSLRDMEQPDAFQNLQNPPNPAWEKIKNACGKAQQEGLQYIWIDTCCIDKSSSAELQEAINSMFQWYALAETCYAFLSDLEPAFPSETPGAPSLFSNIFLDPTSVTECRWFSRGWTLQELLAPPEVHFFDRTWTFRFTRESQTSNIKAAVSIEDSLLLRTEKWEVERIHHALRGVSVAQRMSWAAERQTTRTEDQAYCLLGLFNINMPMLYGEGKKAFTRLQYEIMRMDDDCTLFAWGFRLPVMTTWPEVGQESEMSLYRNEIVNALASSPKDFRSIPGPGILQPCEVDGGKLKRPTFSPNQRGIGISLPLKQDTVFPNVWYGILGSLSNYGALALPLLHGSSYYGELGDEEFFRSSWSGPVKVPRSFMTDAKWSSVTICSTLNIGQKHFDEDKRNSEVSPTIRIAISIDSNPCSEWYNHNFAVRSIYSDHFAQLVMIKFCEQEALRHVRDRLEVTSEAPRPTQRPHNSVNWWFDNVKRGRNKESTNTLAFDIGCVKCAGYRTLLLIRFRQNHTIQGMSITINPSTFGDNDCLFEKLWATVDGAQALWADAVRNNTSGLYTLPTFNQKWRRRLWQGAGYARVNVAILLTDGVSKDSVECDDRMPEDSEPNDPLVLDTANMKIAPGPAVVR